MRSKRFKLNLKDIAKSVTIFFLTSIVSSIASGGIPTDASTFGVVASTAGTASAAYLLKNFLSNSKGDFLKKEETIVETPLKD